MKNIVPLLPQHAHNMQIHQEKYLRTEKRPGTLELFPLIF